MTKTRQSVLRVLQNPFSWRVVWHGVGEEIWFLLMSFYARQKSNFTVSGRVEALICNLISHPTPPHVTRKRFCKTTSVWWRGGGAGAGRRDGVKNHGVDEPREKKWQMDTFWPASQADKGFARGFWLLQRCRRRNLILGAPTLPVTTSAKLRIRQGEISHWWKTVVYISASNLSWFISLCLAHCTFIEVIIPSQWARTARAQSFEFTTDETKLICLVIKLHPKSSSEMQR